MKPKLSLIQKVFIFSFVIFIITGFLLIFFVSREIKNIFLEERKRAVSEVVLKQANRHLNPDDFKTTNYLLVSSRFEDFFEEIKTNEIIRIKVYNSQGIVIFSDEKELLGQKLFQGEEEELKEILGGKIVADITAPIKKEHVYERGYRQLMEIYVPITFGESKEIFGIIETYFKLDFLNEKIWRTQVLLALVITFIFTILFAILFLIVRGASRKLIEQSIHLEKDIEKEKEYSKLKDEFISMASHQLRTPSSSIKWFLEILKGGEAGLLRAKQKEIIEDVYQNNQKIIDIINKLLIVSKIKPDYFEEDQGFYSLEEIIQEVISQLKSELKEKKIELKINISERLPKIKSRKEALLIVIENLIDNAIDYTPKGGKIDITIQTKNNNLFFKIKDTGIGIPKEEQSKIFEKFFRASNALEQKTVGSGLGLHIVKRIIDGYGGKIWFESEEGKGTTFYFSLPLK